MRYRVALAGGLVTVMGAIVAVVGSPEPFIAGATRAVLNRSQQLVRHATGEAPPAQATIQSAELYIVTSALLELRIASHDLRTLEEPTHTDFSVVLDGQPIPVTGGGIRRRVKWAALRSDDSLTGTSVFLSLGRAVQPGETVTLIHQGPSFLGGESWDARLDEGRVSPVLHVSQAGYLPGYPKQAFVGLYLGTAGELSLEGVDTFSVEDLGGREFLTASLRPRADVDMPGNPPPYQQVRVADFSALEEPGLYRLHVPGLGKSEAFRIGDGVAALYARTYAIGLYHQRCGGANVMPFTRFTHGACHLPAAEIPQPGQAPSVETRLSRATHDAPRLESLADALYPPVRGGTLNVRGGHHDAGDYGKYTINSAQFIHHLVFAADVFPVVAQIDNLGLPESGDGVSDLLQLAYWEAEFLARMQDLDGGFFFLIQPRDRSYEDNVLPDEGDPQVVFPKNTSATAAAVAALAQAGSSPTFRAAFPGAAGRYRAAARRGWRFLQRAWAAHGREGAYQKVTHYGDVFQDHDEVVWAATEMFLATGDVAAHQLVLREFDPLSTGARRWGWWGLFEGYGAAIRSYAFARESGRDARRPLDALHLDRTREAATLWGEEVAEASRRSSYGTGYPNASKRWLVAGWYFSENNVFDLLVARQINGGPAFDRAISENLAYVAGANPVNRSFVVGLGRRSPMEPVSQYAQNDRRRLPPSGIPVGNLQQGLPALSVHGRRLIEASLPPDEGVLEPYPIYDRWSDVFNTMTEATIVEQARALAASAILMAETPLAHQSYDRLDVRISGLPDPVVAGESFTLSLQVDGPDPRQAEIVWEWGSGAMRGQQARVSFGTSGVAWVEVEAVWPDGRRGFAVSNVDVE